MRSIRPKLPPCNNRWAGDERVQLQVLTQEECQQRLRTGKSDLYVIADGSKIDYHFDPTRPGSLIARDTVDNLLQRAAGRVDSIVTANHEQNEPGGRYIDFLVPGLIGMGLMGGGTLGRGVCDRRHANSQVAETPTSKRP